MENRFESKILKENIDLTKDPTLFKVLLKPLELYVLKILLINLSPKNIREIYTEAIFICFHHLFSPDLLDREGSYKYLVPNVVGAGYGYGFIDEKEKTKVMKKYIDEAKYISETNQRKLWLKEIISHNSKTPSYDKIRGIFERFESLGIIYKMGKESKGIVFGLNPKFYQAFKDKREEIVKL